MPKPQRFRGRPFRAAAITLAAGVALAVPVGCASNQSQTADGVSGSRPIGEVSEREAAARERAATGTAQVPTGDKALAEWLARAQNDGLITPQPGRAPLQAPRAENANQTADTSETAPAEPVAEATPASDAPPPDGSLAAGPASVEALPLVAPALTSLSEQAAIDSSISASRPLAALVRLHAARAAGDTKVTDAEIGALEKTLTPQEREFFGAWKSLQNAVANGTGSPADIATMKRAASQFADAARGWAELRLPRVALCTRVEGFGMYHELRRAPSSAVASANAASMGSTAGDAYTFLAGRRNKFIVYCEVDGFASRPSATSGKSGYDVELTQDLTLFASGSGRDVVAWRKADQRVRDFSRNQRRDFYLVQIVELPETLSVGGYTLKVRIKDNASTDGAEAEAVIPIDIVADASAMR